MDHKPDLSESDLDELAKEDLNGRQIKNVVKTAQLLAGYEKKSLNINHIRTVLEVTAQTLGQA